MHRRAPTASNSAPNCSGDVGFDALKIYEEQRAMALSLLRTYASHHAGMFINDKLNTQELRQ
jgi:hypothetical protein